MVFLTMMTSENYYYSYSWEPAENGLCSLDFSKREFTENDSRFCNPASIRFLDSVDQLTELFSMFTCVQVGSYDIAMNHKIPTKHFMFFGTKI